MRQCGARSTHKRNGSVDEDAAKSAVTDALTKCLSYLGFNADVFLGKYDDNKYVQNLRQEKQKSQPKRVEQKHEQSDEEKTFHQLMQRIDSAQNLEEATAVGADASQVQINNKQAAQMLDDRIRGKILELSQGVLNNG